MASGRELLKENPLYFILIINKQRQLWCTVLMVRLTSMSELYISLVFLFIFLDYSEYILPKHDTCFRLHNLSLLHYHILVPKILLFLKRIA